MLRKKTNIDPVVTEAQQTIADSSAVLLRQFCRVPAMLNIIASWYEEAAAGLSPAEVFLQKNSFESKNGFVYECKAIVSSIKSVAAEFRLLKQNDRPVIARENSLPMNWLMTGLSRAMPNGALLIPLAFYFQHYASTETRKTIDFKKIEDARNRITVAKRALKEDIPIVTFYLLNELSERAKREIRPETNTRLNYDVESDPSSSSAYNSDNGQKSQPGSKIEPYFSKREKPIDLDIPLANFPELTKRMPLVLERLHDRKIDTLKQLEEFIIVQIIRKNGTVDFDTPYSQSEKRCAHERGISIVKGNILTRGGRIKDQLIESALEIAEALEIAPSSAYENFEFIPSPRSRALDKRFVFQSSPTQNASIQPTP